MKTLYFEVIGSTLVLVHGPLNPSPEDWDEFMQQMAAQKYTGILIDSSGGAPNKSQWAKITDFWRDKLEPKVALTTSSSLVIEAMAATDLVSKSKIRAFRSHALSDAFDYLEISEPEREVLLKTRLRLRARFF
ncbi:MAG: hypothetical protein GY822_06335 [Deltaproteobacteria bacterium]|nr:hypothetical protein [Deltaproteobacteria bacterium]